MENIQIIFFIGTVVALIAVCAFIMYFIVRFHKKTAGCLEQEKSHVMRVNTGFVNRISHVEHILEMENARDVVARELTTMDESGEKCSLDDIDQETWQCISGIYYGLYPILFERDFQKLDIKASIQDLVQFDTRHLNLERYLVQHPSFKEKCFAILKNELERAECSYCHLEELVDSCESWPPFQIWKEEVDQLIQKKASELSQKDLFESRQQLRKQFGEVMTVTKAKDMERHFFEVIVIMGRELLSQEVKKDFHRTSAPVLRDATKILATGGMISSVAKILSILTEKLDEIYPPADANESEDVSS